MMSTPHTGAFTRSNLPEVLRSLIRSHPSGRVFLETDSLRGLISFKNGCINDATFGLQFGVPALLSVLTMDRGRYNFRQTPPSERTTIDETLDALLAQAKAELNDNPVSEPSPRPRTTPSGNRVPEEFFTDIQGLLVGALGPIAAVIADDIVRQMGYTSRELETGRLSEFAAHLIESVPFRKRPELQPAIRSLVSRYSRL